MAVEKFSASLPSDLVRRLDEIAHAEGLSRSGVLREAAAEFAAAHEAKSAKALHRDRVRQAISAFDEIAVAWGDDTLSTLDHLRSVRGLDAENGEVPGGAPQGG